MAPGKRIDMKLGRKKPIEISNKSLKTEDRGGSLHSVRCVYNGIRDLVFEGIVSLNESIDATLC